MRNQPTRDLYAYWNTTRGERAAPERRDIDPVLLRHILGDTFMLEVTSDRGFLLRIAGERLSGLFGRSLKGEDFLDLWPAGERQQISSLCSSVCDDTLPVVAGVVATNKEGATAALEMLLLPLRHFGKTHARIMGVVCADQKPEWLGLLPISSLSLTSMRMLAPPSQSRQEAGTQRTWVQRRSERPHAVALPAPQRQRAHLTVYQGGK